MKAIVTTTINSPTPSIYEFLKQKDWMFIIVGDTKTPHDAYKSLMKDHKNLLYLDCAEQEKLYPELSAVIGWKSVQRRNIGYAFAYNLGAELIYSTDDDNIPYPFWGFTSVNKTMDGIDLYDCETPVFDPLSATNHNYLWHRGFPLSLVKNKNKITYMGKTQTIVGVQADLWDGDPDIDAFQRITVSPCVKFENRPLYMGSGICVFDSQNTFLSRECFPAYSVLPFIGRMDDIFGGYMMQVLRPDLRVVFGPATVYQSRNQHNLSKDLKDEYIGYEHALDFINQLKQTKNLKDLVGIIPKETAEFYEIYAKSFKV